MKSRRVVLRAAVVACLALSACSSGTSEPEAARSASEAVLNGGQYLYLRCNSTDWNVSETSRLQSTSDPNVYQLTIRVTQSWAVNDQCVFTLITASQADSWGTGQTNYTDSKPATGLVVPGGDTMVGPQAAQTNFNVKYPSVGTYLAKVNWATKTFTIGTPGTGTADASTGTTQDAAADAKADATGAVDATADATGAADAAPDSAADAAADAAVIDAAPDSAVIDAAPDSAVIDAAPDSAVVDAADATADDAADASDEPTDDATTDASAALDASADASDASDAASYVPPTGGYPIQCPWLLDPSDGNGGGGAADPGSMRTHLLRSVDFYTHAYDDPASGGAGGYFTYLDQKGSPKSTNKSFEVQSRDAYAFARAFMVSGDTSYLTNARQALDFLAAHGWDKTNGGFVFLGDRNGNWLPAPSGVPSDKWSFTQHYALTGFTAMCEATGDATDCGWMNTGMQLLEMHYWDAVNGSYFNNATLNFSSTWEKGFTPTVDGITPHILLTYLVTGNADYRTRLISLSDDLVNHLVASMTAPGSATGGAGPVVFGFPEFYGNDWSIENNTYGFVGHLYKTAWALARAYLVTQDPKYRTAARQVLMQLWNNGGFDHTNGAPNFDYNFNRGPGSTNKEYWQIEQGFTSGITNWYIATSDSDRATYIEQADRSLCFFMRHMPDNQFGGIFFETNADGSALVNDGSDSATDKGDQWEGSYHNSEFSYYAYVYGNLLLWRRPITLYYDFDATSDEVVPLNPIAIESGALVVTGVTLNGQPYTAFDGTARTLTLPAGTSGVFAVTYAHTP